MSKSLLVIFGATGHQGNSTANYVLDDPLLSQKYTIRAISRDTTHPKMQALASKGAQLIRADLDDPSTLPAALTGAQYVYFMTTTQYQGNTREIETRQAKAFCTEALTQGVKYIIFSSMSHPAKISNGALTGVELFDDKAEIEQYIRSLPVKSAFVAPASFMQNYTTYARPKPAGDGTYVIRNIVRPDTLIPYVDVRDTGKWVGAILAEPEKYEGKFFAAGEGLYTLEDVCGIIAKVTGKTVRYERIPDEVFKGFLGEGLREPLYQMWVFKRDYGYYGSEMKELVDWAKKQARGHLTTFEEFLIKEQFTLE